MPGRSFQSVPVLAGVLGSVVVQDVTFSSYLTKFSAIDCSPVAELDQESRLVGFVFMCVRRPCS